MRRFELIRHDDVTGRSGTGVIAWGVVFPDGRVATRWNGRGAGPAQTSAWDRIGDLVSVHGHDGRTEVRWSADDRLADRLQRIAAAHRKEVGGTGLTSGGCAECGHSWPCPTYVWATTERDLNGAWDPADEEPEDEA